VDAHVRDELYDRARELSAERRTWSQADRLWVEVTVAYRRAVESTDHPDREDLQQLARAQWRHAMLLPQLDRAAEGVHVGRAAVRVFEQVYEEAAAEHPDVTAPERDEALADLVTAVVDLAEIAFMAGDPRARIELLDRAAAVGIGNAGPPPQAGPWTRRALGTAFHNQANARLHQVLPLPTAADVEPAALDASRAVQIRQDLVDLSEPLARWELANSYLLFLRCLVFMDDLERADLVVQLADALVETVGGAPGSDLRRQLESIAAVVHAERASPSGAGRRRWWRRSR
jgi:hypothetical protein